jgi:hypothetical protein
LLPPLALGASLVLGALTPATVDNVNTSSSSLPAARPPSVIYVDSFSISQTSSSSEDDGSSDGGRPHLLGLFRGGQDNTLLGQRKENQYEQTLQKLPGILQRALIQDLNNSIAAAANGDEAETYLHHGWIITGQFLVVDAGDRAMQAGVGFGAGQSHVEVQAQVSTVRDPNNPFLVFNSQGASGHMPGAVVMFNPYVAAAKFVMSKKEPEKEAKKIAQAIAREIGKFMTAQGIPTLASAPAPAAGSSSSAPADSSGTTNESSKGGR